MYQTVEVPGVRFGRLDTRLRNVFLRIVVPFARHGLSLVAPPVCPGCGRAADRRAHGWLCRDCRPSLKARTVCLRCGRRLADIPALALYPAAECRACRRLKPAFDWARSIAPYRDEWREAVLAFKRRPDGELLAQLSGLMRRMIVSGRLPQAWDALVPVPGRRLRERHPATRLAQALARRTGKPCWTVLHYRRRTRPQHGLSRRERLRNMHQSLAASPDRVRGRRLLLIDDVYTTGATSHECARALKAAGAIGVGVLTLAGGEIPSNRK